jgi:hypothetical protein
MGGHRASVGAPRRAAREHPHTAPSHVVRFEAQGCGDGGTGLQNQEHNRFHASVTLHAHHSRSTLPLTLRSQTGHRLLLNWTTDTCAVALSAAERPQTSILYRSLFTTGLCTAFADVGMGLVHSSILAAVKCHAVPRPLSTPKGKAWGKADGSAPGVHRLREGGPRASSIGARGTTRPHLAFFCFAAALLAAE